MAAVLFMALIAPEPARAADGSERPAGSRETSLNWEEIEGAAAYEVDIRFAASTETGAPSGRAGGGIVNQSTFAAYLLPGKYELRLRALDRRRVPGPWGDWTPFDVTPSPVVLTAPRAGERLRVNDTDQTKVTLAWKSSYGISRYRWRVIDAASGNVVASGDTGDTDIAANLPVGATYTWDVIALATGGLESPPPRVERRFSIIGGVLETPIIRMKTENDSLVGASWNIPAGVGSFDVRVLLRPGKATQWKPVKNLTNTTERDIAFNPKWPPGRVKIGVRSRGPLRVASGWTWEESDWRQGSDVAVDESLPENPGPSLVDISLESGLGVESVAIKGGTSSFDASSAIYYFHAASKTRMDPTQGDRWVVGLSARLHDFNAYVERENTAAEIQTFRRLFANAWLGYELLNPTGTPTSLILGAGVAAGRVPALRMDNLDEARGELDDKSWATALGHFEFTWRPRFTGALGVNVDAATKTLTDGKSTRYAATATWQSALINGILPTGWMIELRAATARETRVTPFSCGGVPSCVSSSTTGVTTTTVGTAVGVAL